ncbi:MAG: hypothetical protein JRI62_02045 [Deltaproteobacteria bacterium]|nr:hypothetical protein [Deltaproteobacteria bacterium]
MRNKNMFKIKFKIIILATVFLTTSLMLPYFAHATATFVIINGDAAGEGFNDPGAPDPASTAGGNTGATLGAQRLQALQFVADIWGNLIDSSVDIRIEAEFNPQYCTSTSAVLASCGAISVAYNFAGALRADTLYSIALANKLAGTDLDPTNNDIGATFNSDIGTASCLDTYSWYYGLDASPPIGGIDFVSIALHELAHGLGFQTFVNLTTGAKFNGYDDHFMIYLGDHSTGMLYPDMTNAERVTASTDTGDLHWTGPVVVAESIFLTAGRHQPSGHVEMYAPSPAEPGSSVSHFSTSLIPDQIMEPAYLGPNHDVGLAGALMADIGWMTGEPVDLYVLVDLSGSYMDDIAEFKTNANSLINDLDTRFDLKVGLGSFVDYPINPFGSATYGDYAYQQVLDLTADTANVITAINGLSIVSGAGADDPESQLAALYQAATGAGQVISGYPGATIATNQQANFRNNVIKLFLLWTDAPFHYPGDPGDISYPGPSFNDTISAIMALDPPQVLGIRSGDDEGALEDLREIAEGTGALAPEGGVDCDGDGTNDILEGDPIVCSVAVTGEGIAQAMAAVVEAAVEPYTAEIVVRNPINLKSKIVAVYILTTYIVDAQDIDPESICFGSVATPGIGDCTEAHGNYNFKDIDGDGDDDMVLHFNTGETGFTMGDTQACITGKTLTTGHKIQGCTDIHILSPRN